MKTFKNISLYVVLICCCCLQGICSDTTHRTSPFSPPIQQLKKIQKNRHKLALHGIITCKNEYRALVHDGAQTHVVREGDCIGSYIVQKILMHSVDCQKNTEKITLCLRATPIEKRREKRMG